MRPIDADELVAWGVETYQVQSTSEGKAYVNAFLTRVDSCHTLDAVEVVRCKDCRFWWLNNGQIHHEFCMCPEDERPNADDYCSYGERREK